VGLGFDPLRGIKDEQVNGAAYAEGQSAVEPKCCEALDRSWKNSYGRTTGRRGSVLRIRRRFQAAGFDGGEVIDDLVFNRLIKRRIDIAFTREFSTASIETSIKEMELRERSGVQYWLRIAGLSNHYPIRPSD
jgi:hypothetical protein